MRMSWPVQWAAKMSMGSMVGPVDVAGAAGNVARAAGAASKLGSDRNFSAQRSEAPAGSACSRENLGSDPNLL